MNTDTTQETLWNGAAGRAWVEAQALLDQVLRPLEQPLVDAVAGERVLDVGCGTGATTRAVARRIGACTGIDISEPMIAAARERARRDDVPARFIRADAQTHDFAPERFDTVISRFGVMFFDDPVSAFANLRSTADGALCCLTWRDAAENPFMTTAERAARPLLPDLPAREPDAPGQFAFADREHVAGILRASGWAGIDLQPVDVECMLPEHQLVPYIARFGPVGRMLADADETTRAAVVETARAAFDPFVHGAEVRFTAACWMVTARAA
jgi:SAM-dependent methyltransferase